MPAGPDFFTAARHTNISHSALNAAAGDINVTYCMNQSIEENKILAALKPVERVGHTHGCMEGTREEVIDEISSWLDDFTDDSKNILLLSSSPGAGKSTIAATIVSYLDSLKRLGSSFAFKHSDANLSDPDAVWRTIASDLARFHPAVKSSLVDILKGVDPGSADIGLQFRRLIEAPLTDNREELSRKPPVIVLDGLDECGSDRSQSDQRRRLLDTLTQWHKLPRTFKLIVTSRDERLPNSFCVVCRPLVLHTGSRVNDEAANDIGHFLRRRFGDVSDKYPSLSEWPGESTIKQLTRRAAGLFIWVETLVRFVDNEQCPPDVQLDLFLHGDLGEEEDTVNGIYRRILEVSFADSKKPILDAFHSIVGTIVCAKVPLSRDDLPHFLSTPLKTTLIDFILHKLSSVISIGKTDDVIHICHLSFAEFLCDPSRNPKYTIDTASHSRQLSAACFRLMKKSLKFNICRLETSYLRNCDVADLPARIETSIPTYLSYVCRFVGKHLRDAPNEGSSCGQLLEDIDDFLHVRLLYWLEVMSLLEEVSTALISLHYVVRWIGNSNTELAAFAADAAKFVINFATPISTSIPHIYLSALPFSPTKSRIAQHFLPKFRNMLSISAGQENDWPATVNLLTGHTGGVNAVEFSPDGKRIVSGSDDKTIRIWDAQTGEVVAGPFEGHTGPVNGIGFSPDGKHIVSGSVDKTISIWDAATGEVVAGPLNGHTGSIRAVGFSPDGKHIVSGSSDRTICIWDAATGEVVVSPFEGHTDWVNAVGFSPDGKHIVSGSDDTTICIWDAERGEVIAGLPKGHTDCVNAVGFSPDGKHIVSGSSDKTICIWHAATGEVVAGPFEGHIDWVKAVRFSPDGKHIVSGSDDNIICIWDAATGEVVASPFQGHSDRVNAVGFSPDGTHIVSGSADTTIRIWDAERREMIAGPPKGHTSYVLAVGFSPDGKHIVSGSDDKTICIWDTATGEVVAGPFEGHTGCVNAVGFLPDGKHIVSGSNDTTIRIWDAERGEVVAGPFEGHTNCVLAVGFSPDGKHIVSGSSDNTICIWDAATGEVVAGPFQGHTDYVNAVGFSPDGKHIVSGSSDNTICIWDAATSEVVAGPFEGHTDWVNAVGFSPDGKHIVSGSFDKTICIWDAATGEVVAGPCESHTEWVNAVGFSPDGKHIVSGSDDKTICIWDAAMSEVVAGPFEGHTDWVNAVGISPDGKRIVSGSSDMTIRIWDAETGEVVATPLEGYTHGVNAVEFSPEGNRIVSRSHDGTIHICDAEAGEVVAPLQGNLDWDLNIHSSQYAKHLRKFNHCHLDFSSGWVKTEDGNGLLFWVPFHLRDRILGTDTLVIIGRSMVRLDFSSFAHGPHWLQCRLSH